MTRREFLAAGAAAAAAAAIAEDAMADLAREAMPVLFTAHGNPLNAIRETPFSKFLSGWARSFPRPKAILAISAHWEGPSLAVTAAPKPDTVHDFYGFPQEMYDIRYPAPGSPAVAKRTKQLLDAAGLACTPDPKRGLDHGAWAPLLRMYPLADIPVVQISLRAGSSGEDHVVVGRAIAPLAREGVLILGSGNLVHNLGRVDFGSVDAPVVPWASAFDAWVKAQLDANRPRSLARYLDEAPDARTCHPTPEHYVPLLVCAGAATASAAPRVRHVFERFEHASISMRCVRFDPT